MSLIFNGVIIPEDYQADALQFNGVQIMNVYMNGITVWTQEVLPPFSQTWSGDSTTGGFGLQTSGASVRMIGQSDSGIWVPVDAFGKWNDTSSTATAAFIGQVGFKAGSDGTLTALGGAIIAPTVVTYTIGTGFTGASGDATNYLEFQTSGGQIRYVSGSAIGAWITLT